ncbi:protein gamma response 1 [Manihot esculenta]|nr:protein gamma response 1 [Manihot esculenta]
MEVGLQYSPKPGCPAEDDDLKYVSKLSTILVATIQEAKDRISQIEYIFCSQLYSNFQMKSKSLQKLYLEAKKEAEDSWKEKEKNLQLQIEKLLLEKQELLEEKLEKEKSLGELDNKINSLVLKETSLQVRVDELEQKVREKSKEVDDGMELHNRLLQLVQTKSSMILEKEKQLNDYEEKTNGLLAKLKSLEKKVEELEGELKRETLKVAEKKEIEKDLLKRINSLLSHLSDSAEKSERLEEDVSKLQRQLQKKTEEVEEGRVSKAQLLQQIDMDKLDILKQKQQLEKSENDKKLLLETVNALEEKMNELKENLSSCSKVAEEKDSYEKRLQQIALKETQLLAEKKKTKNIFDAYKRLKSQYKFLCAKSGLTEENMLPQIKLVAEIGSIMHQNNLTTSPDFASRHPDTSTAACEIKKVKIENDVSDLLEEDKVVKSIPTPSIHSPSSIHIAPKCLPTAKSAPVIGTKRPASRWIATRSHQNRDGPDPHDDFLNTPLQNLRRTLNKTMEEDHDLQIPIPVQKDLHSDSSDDETQDMNVVPSPEKQQMPLSMAGQKSFKYVEPVRKKAERDNLKGVECKQCKKFYDAVLPNGGKDADGNKQNFRCEHHDGVSRHRYKYVPPLTPEGFWNIGFESEM